MLNAGLILSPLIEELINLHRGQGLDLLWRDTFSCPSEEEYLAMVNDSE
jgi:geranylgeranyl diphosphate synthase type 3